MAGPLRVTFVTGNKKKLEEVVAILGTEHAARYVMGVREERSEAQSYSLFCFRQRRP